MGSKKQTIGYHYLMSMLSGLWRGPLDSIIQIKVGDKNAWSGTVTDDTLSMIKAPELFGGEKKEGGIQGGFRVFMGSDDQVLAPTANYSSTSLPGAGKILGPASSGTLYNPKTLIGGLVSEFRGVVTFWFDGLVSSMNPYPKEWKFRGRRTRAGWWQGANYPLAPNDGPSCWYAAKCKIELADGAIHAMNPAHIVYQCVTDPNWGRGLPLDLIDHNSFTYCADLFYDEAFGLCLTWYRSDNEDVEDFIKIVLNHVGAALYTDRETGLLTLRPIRGDYDPDELPLFDEDSGLIDISYDDNASASKGYNEVIVKGHNPIDDKDFEMRAQNTAAWQESQAANAYRVEYKGLPTPELAGRVAARELKVFASGLKKYKVVLDRHAWRIAPASCFRVSSTKRGIQNVVLRAGEIDESPIDDGRITISAVEDVFGLAETSFIDPVESTWVSPDGQAYPPLAEILMEAGYRDVYLHSSQADAQAMLPYEGTIAQMAVAPNVYSLEFDLQTKAEGEEYDIKTSGVFTGTALLSADVDPLDDTFLLSGIKFIDDTNIGQALWIGDELVALLDIDGSTITVKRGCGDTVPKAHFSGDRIWTIDDDVVSDERSYAQGETVYSKVLTRTSSDRLLPEEASENSVVIVGRAARPYPPADLKVNDVSFFAFAGVSDAPVTITYASRNRISQADSLVGHEEPSVAPEPGTDYRIDIGLIGETSPIRTTYTTALSWTYTDAMRIEDGDPDDVWMEVSSRRDGLLSWQKYHFDVSLDYEAVPPALPFAFGPDLTYIADPSEGTGTDIEVSSISDQYFAARFFWSGTDGGSADTGTYFAAAIAPVDGEYTIEVDAALSNWSVMVVSSTDPDDPYTTAVESPIAIYGPTGSDPSGGNGTQTDAMTFDTGTLDGGAGSYWFVIASPGGLILDDTDPDVIAEITLTVTTGG